MYFGTKRNKNLAFCPQISCQISIASHAEAVSNTKHISILLHFTLKSEEP